MTAPATATATALRKLACHSCRQWTLRTFITAAVGPSIPPQSLASQIRPFGGTPRRRNEAWERVQAAPQTDAMEEDEHALNAITASHPAPEAPKTPGEPPGRPNASEYTPWYLEPQHQPTQPTPESPLLARQRIPDLPHNPPPLLEPLLHNLSLTQGLDDLTLLDLRSLNPPPALGANLLMILGTARSEKHLHVSADRLCRWLRSEPWHLTPYADGLLGRNELKLKLRRRAKRTKIMAAAVGVSGTATSDADVEDGLRTGWVCVNIGRVPGGELEETRVEREARRRGVVGFGGEDAGCSLVVQMLVEEKREEIGLEGLWTGMLRRSEREREERRRRADGENGVTAELDGAGVVGAEGTVQRDTRAVAG